MRAGIVGTGEMGRPLVTARAAAADAGARLGALGAADAVLKRTATG